MLQVLDLFAGIGGFSLGLERTGGFRTVAFCEIDDYASHILNRHWPNIPVFRDVRVLDAATLAAHGIDRIDVVCGGFPCQDISLAGCGAGLGGERSGLWFEMYRVIAETRPRFVVIENVSVLRSRGLETVLGGLAALGYDAEWHCITAASVGAPHRRDRVWIIAYARGAGLEGWIKPITTRPTQRELAGRPFGCGASWPDAPTIPRVGYGVSDWVDRLRCLGNAVVPQIPEIIGRSILHKIAT